MFKFVLCCKKFVLCCKDGVEVFDVYCSDSDVAMGVGGAPCGFYGCAIVEDEGGGAACAVVGVKLFANAQVSIAID